MPQETATSWSQPLCWQRTGVGSALQGSFPQSNYMILVCLICVVTISQQGTAIEHVDFPD